MSPNEEPSPEIIKLLAGLIRDQLCLEENQVVIYNQSWKIPPDKGIYIVIAYLAGAPFGFHKNYRDVPTTATDGLHEVQTVNVRETYTINLFSESGEARQRKNEIQFAFNSDQAANLMERFSFRIANLPISFIDVSEVEETARLNRYEATFNVLTSYKRERPTPFYDKFTVPPKILVNA